MYIVKFPVIVVVYVATSLVNKDEYITGRADPRLVFGVGTGVPGADVRRANVHSRRHRSIRSRPSVVRLLSPASSSLAPSLRFLPRQTSRFADVFSRKRRNDLLCPVCVNDIATSFTPRCPDSLCPLTKLHLVTASVL